MVFQRRSSNGLQSEKFFREESSPADKPDYSLGKDPDEPHWVQTSKPWNKWAVVLSHQICGNLKI